MVYKIFFIVFCVGEIEEKTAHCFPYYSKCVVWKIQYSGWQIQHGWHSKDVKSLIKLGIIIDRVNNSNVVLDVGR